MACGKRAQHFVKNRELFSGIVLCDPLIPDRFLENVPFGKGVARNGKGGGDDKDYFVHFSPNRLKTGSPKSIK